MKHRRDWAGSTGLMPVELVPRDPISAILTLVTNSPIFFLGPAAVSATASALSALAITAAVAGVQYLLTPKPPRPEDGKQPLTQALAPRLYGVGTNRIAGAYMLWEEKNNRLYAVQALCGHPINAITRYYLHDDIVTTNGAGWVISASTDDGRYGENPDRVKIDHRLGNVPEVPYADVVSAFGSEGIWTNDHRGDGQASLAVMCVGPNAEGFQGDFPHGVPQPSVVAEMAKVFDPRDPTQKVNNPATWKFSDNAALCLIWQECFNPFGPRQLYARAILPVLDRWIEEANICDEIIGGERRYRVNGWASTDTDPVGVQNSILAACDGHLVRRGDGAVILTVGKFREYLVETITDADIVGHTLQNEYPEEESINRLVPKFTYPATDYTTTDTDYFEDTAAQVIDGRILPRDASFEWVHSWRQARRLGKREWLRRQEKVHGTLNLRLSGINAAYARWVRLEAPLRLPSLNGKVIENRRAILALMQGGFQMDFIRHPENIDAWNPATDEGSAPPVPAKPSSDGIPTAVIDTVSAVAAAGSVFLRVALADPGRSDLTAVVQYRVKNNGSPLAWVTQTFNDLEIAAGLVQLETSPVPNDRLLEVRAAWRATRGTTGTHSPIVEVQSTADTVAPQALLAVSAGTGTGQFVANFGTRNDPHLASVAIYRVPVGQALNPSAHLAANPAVSPGISYSVPVTSPAGSWNIYLRPLNRSGIAGPISGPHAVTVT